MSHPVWVRGLKPDCSLICQIEFQSHPVWVRGLKPRFTSDNVSIPKSHPVWVRGLKHILIISMLKTG